jgi:hypothetical protein
MSEPPAPPVSSPADHTLAAGVEINGYRIVRVLGAGGFGITYLAEHVVMQDQVAIKEFLPITVARRAADGVSVRPVTASDGETFAWGLDRFAKEAQTLARLRGHPNIVPVLTYFPAHGTGYLVMEFVRGRSLRQMLRDEAPLPEARLRSVVEGVLGALETIHAAEFLHRDIKPDNVIVRPDGTPVLIDFGSARQVLGQRTKAATEIVSPGYSPYEQYDSDGDHGPWTDLYALGATLYECVTGRRPAESPGRIGARYKQKPDPVAPASIAAAGRYAPGLLAAIDAALGVIESERPRSVADFRAALDQGAPAAAKGAAAPAPPPAENGAATTFVLKAGDRTLTAGEAAPAATLMPAAGAPQPAAAALTPAEPPRSRRGLVFAVVGALALAGIGAFALTRFGGDSPSEDARKAAEEETRRKAEAEAKANAEAEAKRKAEEEAKAKAEEAARKAKEEEEEAKRKAEEEEKAKAAEEARKRNEEARRRQQEEERRKAEEAARRRAAEEEARRKAEEERRAREAACPAGQRRPDGSCIEGRR